MRTLKKTLCMVLVLAMMVGLCAISASAVTIDDYSDKDTIAHKEAVAILSKLDVLQGDDKGTFRPADPLTRAESAAFFTRLCNASGIGTSSFTDMVGHWAQPYVSYCEAAGIINGRGDGTFAPNDSVTYIQWAKMCLGALGYDATIEGLVGSAWEVNTLKLVNRLDLAAGILKFDWNAPITRDDAAQMGYNVLKKTVVEYPDTLNIKVQTGDTNVQIEGAAFYEDVVNVSYDYMNRAGNTTMQFCEDKFPNLKLKAHAVEENRDAFGAPQNTWFMGDNRKDHNLTPAKTIVSELAGTVMATYTTDVATVTSKTIYTDGALAATTKLDTWENGVELEDGIDTLVVANRLSTDKVLSKYAGATVLLLDTSNENQAGYGKADTVIVKYPVLAKVTKISEATAKADRTATLQVFNVVNGTKSVEYVTKNFAKNDYILIYPGVKLADLATYTTAAAWKNIRIRTSALADTVPGSLSKVSTIAGNAYALTIGGISYSVGAEKLALLGPKDGVPVATSQNNYATGTGITGYTSNGYVLGVVSDAVTYGEFVFVLKKGKNDGVLGSDYVAGYLNQDGTTASTAQFYAPSTAYIPTATSALENVNLWATVTPIAGKTAFTPTSALDYATQVDLSGSFTIKPDSPTVICGGKSFVADAKTVFIVNNGILNSVYVGIGSMPTITGTALKAYALVPTYTGAHAAAVYVDASAPGTTIKGATAASIYLLNKGNSTAKENGALGPVYTFSAIVNGELKTDIQAQSASFGVYGPVTPTYDSSTGYLTAVTKYDTFSVLGTGVSYVTAAADLVAANGLLTINGISYGIDDAAKIYIYNENDPFADINATIDDLNGVEAGATVSAFGSLNSNIIKTVYIVIPYAP